MRNISFALTTEQIRNQTKTVTRRLGWKFLRPGDLLQPIVKGQGLKKGERIEKIGGPIRVSRVSREMLASILFEQGGVTREGFPLLTADDFIDLFRVANGLDSDDAEVTRIEFSYVEAGDKRGRSPSMKTHEPSTRA